MRVVGERGWIAHSMRLAVGDVLIIGVECVKVWWWVVKVEGGCDGDDWRREKRGRR